MTTSDREALWRILSARRDHRHFQPDPVPPEVLQRLLDVFRVAPSVGLSQPWHLTVLQNPALKEAVYQSFTQVRKAEEQHFTGERRTLYDTLKLEGIREAPIGLVVSFVPPKQATLGTTSQPKALEYSVVSAITLLWLAATAEGLGMGWVSLVNSEEISQALELPSHIQPLAYLCIGYPALDLKEPLLKTVGWAKQNELEIDWK